MQNPSWALQLAKPLSGRRAGLGFDSPLQCGSPIGHTVFTPPVNTMSSVLVSPHVFKKSALSLSLFLFSFIFSSSSSSFSSFLFLYFYLFLKINKHLWFLLRKRIGSSGWVSVFLKMQMMLLQNQWLSACSIEDMELRSRRCDDVVLTPYLCSWPFHFRVKDERGWDTLDLALFAAFRRYRCWKECFLQSSRKNIYKN